MFETARLVVRPKVLEDADALHAVYGDDAVMRHVGGAFASLAQTREFVTAHIRHQQRHGFGTLGFTRVSAYVETANAASVRIAEKLGMRLVRSGADGVPPWAEYVATTASGRSP